MAAKGSSDQESRGATEAEREGSVRSIAEIPALPNGVAFGADGRLYVAQSLTRKILAYDWSDGELGEPSARQQFVGCEPRPVSIVSASAPAASYTWTAWPMLPQT